MYHNRRTIVKTNVLQGEYKNAFENGKLKKGFRYIKGGDIVTPDGTTIKKAA